MSADDPRQYMLRDDFEIYAKSGVPSGAMEMHFHNFYEIMFIESGEFSILLSNTTYRLKKSDLLFISPNTLHHYQYVSEAHRGSKRILLWITASYLERLAKGRLDILSELEKEAHPAKHLSSYQNTRLHNYLNHLLYLGSDFVSTDTEKGLLQDSYLTLFFICFLQISRNQSAALVFPEVSRNELITRVSDYIDAHIGEEIPLDVLAREMHISKYHFIRTFKEDTGMTVHDYINQKRILHASEMLRGEMPLETISELCGFSSYTAFFRNFKAIYAIPPQAYRQYVTDQN